jgi:hypothetical protein
MSTEGKSASPARTAILVGFGMGLAFVVVMYVLLPMLLDALPVDAGWTPAADLSELKPVASTFRVLRDGKVVISGTLHNPTDIAYNRVSFTADVSTAGELIERCHAMNVEAPSRSKTPFVITCLNQWKEMDPSTLSAAFEVQGAFASQGT